MMLPNIIILSLSVNIAFVLLLFCVFFFDFQLLPLVTIEDEDEIGQLLNCASCVFISQVGFFLIPILRFLLARLLLLLLLLLFKFLPQLLLAI